MAAIKTQRSAVLLLENITFQPNPNNVNQQQQPLENGTLIEATDSSTVYLKNDIVIDTNADVWFEATNNSFIRYLENYTLKLTNRVNDPDNTPIRLISNSSMDIGNKDSALFETQGMTRDLTFSNTYIDTTSALYCNLDIETSIKTDLDDVKGSINNVFYSGGSASPVEDPYVQHSFVGTGASVDQNNSIAIGSEATVFSSIEGIAIGHNARAEGNKSTSIGADTLSKSEAFSGGIFANSNGRANIAIGKSATSQGGGSSATNPRIAIGGSTYSSGSSSISIGTRSNSETEYSIAIGADSDVEFGDRAIAIGFQASAGYYYSYGGDYYEDPATDSIVIGSYSSSKAPGTVAIGTNTKIEAGGNNSIAIGANAQVEGDSSVQIGSGINTTDLTLQYRTQTIANDNGLYTSFNSPTNYTPTNTSNVTSHFEAIDTALGNNIGVEGEPYVNIESINALPSIDNATESLNIGSNVINSGNDLLSIGNNNTLSGVNNNNSDISKIVQIGFDNEYTELFFGGLLGNSVQIGVGNENVNSSWDLVQIGYNNTTNGSANNSFILGSNCIINNDSSGSVAIGDSAIIGNNVINSVQIGSGTNNNLNTIQFKDTTLANSEGIQVKSGSGVPTSTPADGTLYVDTTGLKLYFRAGGQWIPAN